MLRCKGKLQLGGIDRKMAKTKSSKNKKERTIKIVASIVALFFLLSIFIMWGMYFIGR